MLRAAPKAKRVLRGRAKRRAEKSLFAVFGLGANVAKLNLAGIGTGLAELVIGCFFAVGGRDRGELCALTGGRGEGRRADQCKCEPWLEAEGRT